MQDGTGDGTSECPRDGTADETLDAAWDKAEDNDADVEYDVDRRWGCVVKAYWVSKVWPLIACWCSGHHCDQADFVPMSGPNEGAFLFPGHHGKCLMIYPLMWTDHTFDSLFQLLTLLWREPVEIARVVITKLAHQVDHGNVHLDRSAIRKIALKFDFTIRHIPILVCGLHACMWIPMPSSSSIFTFIATVWIAI